MLVKVIPSTHTFRKTARRSRSYSGVEQYHDAGSVLFAMSDMSFSVQVFKTNVNVSRYLSVVQRQLYQAGKQDFQAASFWMLIMPTTSPFPMWDKVT